MEKETLWRTVVHTRYDADWGGWVSEMTNEHYGASLCNHVRNGWEHFLLSSNLKLVMANMIDFA